MVGGAPERQRRVRVQLHATGADRAASLTNITPATRTRLGESLGDDRRPLGSVVVTGVDASRQFIDNKIARSSCPVKITDLP